MLVNPLSRKPFEFDTYIYNYAYYNNKYKNAASRYPQEGIDESSKEIEFVGPVTILFNTTYFYKSFIIHY